MGYGCGSDYRYRPAKSQGNSVDRMSSAASPLRHVVSSHTIAYATMRAPSILLRTMVKKICDGDNARTRVYNASRQDNTMSRGCNGGLRTVSMAGFLRAGNLASSGKNQDHGAGGRKRSLRLLQA